MRRRNNAGGLARVVAGGTCLMWLAATAAVAEEAPLEPGQRVRVTALGAAQPRLVGSIVALDDTHLSLQVAGRPEPVTVPRTQIARLEVSHGPASRGVHALIGALAGGLLGGAVGVHQRGPEYPGMAQTAGALAGALVGGLIGVAMPPGERWRPVPSATRRVQLVPRPDLGAGLGVALAF